MAKAKRQPTQEGLHDAAIGNIYDVLTGKKEFDETTQIAMKYLNYESRGDMLLHSKSKLSFSMVKALTDQEVLRKYVTATVPDVKRLTA